LLYTWRVAQIVVHVKPGSRKSGVDMSEGVVMLRVIEQAQDGRANEAARALLATTLGIPRRRISLARGARSKEKAFAVEGVERDAILARLLAYCRNGSASG
jgi:uncharacterized protein YggU (UPF0235/DUF167 family)